MNANGITMQKLGQTGKTCRLLCFSLGGASGAKCFGQFLIDIPTYEPDKRPLKIFLTIYERLPPSFPLDKCNNIKLLLFSEGTKHC